MSVFLAAVAIALVLLTNYVAPRDQRGYFSLIIVLFALSVLAWALDAHLLWQSYR